MGGNLTFQQDHGTSGTGLGGEWPCVWVPNGELCVYSGSYPMQRCRAHVIWVWEWRRETRIPLERRGPPQISAHDRPKYFEWNLAKEKLEGFFPIKIRNFKLGEMSIFNLIRFPEGFIIFQSWNNTEQKGPLKHFFCLRTTASLGGWFLRGYA